MSETDPKGVARAYLAALGAKDYDAVGALLHPDLAFRGTMMTFDNAADFLAGVRMLEPINERVDIKSLIAEGGAAAHSTISSPADRWAPRGCPSTTRSRMARSAPSSSTSIPAPGVPELGSVQRGLRPCI